MTRNPTRLNYQATQLHLQLSCSSSLHHIAIKYYLSEGQNKQL